MPLNPIHKNKLNLDQRYTKRVLLLVACMILLSLILLGRLFYLQIIQHNNYSAQSHNNLLNIVPSAPNRGLIKDRFGHLLAENVPSYTLSLMAAKKTVLNHRINELRRILPISKREEARFFKLRPHYRLYQPIPLKTRLTNEELARFAVNEYRLPGTYIDTQMRRTYPDGDIAGQLLGYVGRINNREASHVNMANYSAQPMIGKAGVEKYYENLLHGQSGHRSFEINAKGQVIRSLNSHPSIRGTNLTLTIDTKLQRLAQKILGKEFGAIVLLDPNNGDILAAASQPTYDNNLFSGGISHANYEKLLHADGHPLYNRILQGRFAPGSTVKPFIALAGLDSHIVTPEHRVFDPGHFKVKGTKHVYHDWKLTGHGWVNVTKAIKVSCDVYFYQLAEKMGILHLYQALDEFGFGKKSGVDLPGELSGLLPSPDWKKAIHNTPWYTGDTIETGIGQGFFLITPLQLASSVATIATRGKRVVPHILKSYTTPDGTVHTFAPEELPPVTLSDPHNWDTVIHAMQQVIDGRHGSGYYFGKHRGFSVAGKTGTAQVYGHHRDEDRTRRDLPKKLRNNHLFIAFAPITHPRVVVVVIIEHNAWADKKAGQMLRAYFKAYPTSMKTQGNA
mgnify:CR=1 FL=1